MPLAYIYGAIAYYLEHQVEIDAWIHETDEMDAARQAEEEAANPEFYARRRQRFAELRARRAREQADAQPEQQSSLA